MFGGGFVLSYRWFALCVIFGRAEINIDECPLQGLGRCGLSHGHSALAVVSFYLIVGSRYELDLDLTSGGGFVLSNLRFALGLVLCVMFGGGFV